MAWVVRLLDERGEIGPFQESFEGRSEAVRYARQLAALARVRPGFCVSGSGERGYMLRPDGSAWIEVGEHGESSG